MTTFVVTYPDNKPRQDLSKNLYIVNFKVDYYDLWGNPLSDFVSIPVTSTSFRLVIIKAEAKIRASYPTCRRVTYHNTLNMGNSEEVAKLFD